MVEINIYLMMADFKCWVITLESANMGWFDPTDSSKHTNVKNQQTRELVSAQKMLHCHIKTTTKT